MMNSNTPNPKAVANLIKGTPDVLKMMLSELDDALLSWRPAEGEWCIKEVIGHMIDMDTLAFADRIQIILDEDTPSMESLNVDEIEAKRQDDKRPLSELIESFTKERIQAVEYLNNLSAEHLHRTGTFPVNRHFKASDFLYEWPYHDQEHIKQICDIIQDFVWPNLSETMQKALRG